MATPDAALANAVPSASYSQTLLATGGDGLNNTWAIIAGNLPTGLSLSASGEITGTPSGSAETFTVQVTNGDEQTATQELTITVNAS